MILLNLIRNFDEQRAVMGRRRRRPRSRVARAVAVRLPALTDGRGTEAARIGKSILGAAAGTAAILTIKVSMIWTALQAI